MPELGNVRNGKTYVQCPVCENKRFVILSNTRYAPASVTKRFQKRCRDCRNKQDNRWRPPYKQPHVKGFD